MSVRMCVCLESQDKRTSRTGRGGYPPQTEEWAELVSYNEGNNFVLYA